MDILLKEFLHTGVSVAYYNTKHLENTIDTFTTEDKLSKEDGIALLQIFHEDIQQKREEFEDILKGLIDEILNKLELKSRNEVYQLKAEIEHLKAQLSQSSTTTS